MATTTFCPNCNLEMRIPSELVASDVKCPGCTTIFFPHELDPTVHSGIQSHGKNQPINDSNQPVAKKISIVPWLVAGIAGFVFLSLLGIFFLAAIIQWNINRNSAVSPEMAAMSDQDVWDQRSGFRTKLTKQVRDGQRAELAPRRLFNTIKYDSPAGKLSAYVTRDPGDGDKHPAIIWIFGGFDNGIGATAWARQDPANDQSASAFREEGIVMMYPSFRGGNDNPGFQEAFLGEVDDVLAAADHLASLPYVDPDRIYLGGHSTGGTMALLCACFSDRFRATLALGPVDDVRGYGADILPFDIWSASELKFRNPINWIDRAPNRVFMIEGRSGNADCINSLVAQASSNPKVSGFVIGGDHFGIIQPVTKLMAKKIIEDTGEECNIALDQEELNRLRLR